MILSRPPLFIFYQVFAVYWYLTRDLNLVTWHWEPCHWRASRHCHPVCFSVLYSKYSARCSPLLLLECFVVSAAWNLTHPAAFFIVPVFFGRCLLKPILWFCFSFFRQQCLCPYRWNCWVLFWHWFYVGCADRSS